MNICFENQCYDNFQVSSNFGPVEEILEIWYQIYILIEKVIILGKIYVIINSFAPPFFSHFSLSLNRKKTFGNQSHEIETKHIHASAVDNSKSRLMQMSESVPRMCSVWKEFLKISQNGQENICARVSFVIKLQDYGMKLY